MSVKLIEEETNVIVSPCYAPHLKALPEDGLAAEAVALRDVATLAHELQLKCGAQENTIKGGQLTEYDKHTSYTLAHELQLMCGGQGNTIKWG